MFVKPFGVLLTSISSQIFCALVLLLSTVSLPSAYAASDDCTDCITRKQRICSEECDSVEPARAIICQKRCVGGYCSHYCHSKAPELLALAEENCTACRDRQYGLCETHCPTGTLRERAACQLKCSEDRCAPRCKGKNPEDEKMVPIPPEAVPGKAPKVPVPEQTEPSEDEVDTPGLDEEETN